MVKPINIGLIGFGNIGTGVVRALNENGRLIASRLPRPIKISRIADIDLASVRPVKYDKSILTSDTMSVVKDPSIDIIIEVIGGIKAARKVVATALRRKKHVVTANKALLAHYGADLLALARANGVSLLYEAAVGAGIPIIRSIAYSYAADRIKTIRGILNGTTNYILTGMEEQGRDFRDVLKEAQLKGYAEPDPTFDVEGYDTAHKLCILASMAFGQDIRIDSVFTSGITRVQKEDLVCARELGYTIKLLGIARLHKDGKVEVRVHPTLIPRTSMLASIRGVFNAMEIDGEPVGCQMLYGRGAGWGSTSSAILGDVMDIASAIASGAHIPYPVEIPVGQKDIKPMEELMTAHYIRMTLRDASGMLAKVSSVFGRNRIGIKSVLQKTSDRRGYVCAIFITHKALEGSVQKALDILKGKKLCREKPFVLRFEE